MRIRPEGSLVLAPGVASGIILGVYSKKQRVFWSILWEKAPHCGSADFISSLKVDASVRSVASRSDIWILSGAKSLTCRWRT